MQSEKLYNYLSLAAIIAWMAYQAASYGGYLPNIFGDRLHTSIPFMDGGTRPTRLVSIPRNRSQVEKNNEQDGQCLPGEIESDIPVAILGAYEGGSDTSYSFGVSNHPLKTVRVHGADTKAPVVIALSAYDPILWDFEHFPADRLKAVIVYGYYNQAVGNIPKNTPVRFVAKSEKSPGCGEALFAYNGGRDLDALVSQVEAVTGLSVKSFHGDYDPDAISIDDNYAFGKQKVDTGGKSQPLANVHASADIFLSALAPLEKGLDQLLKDGAIRPATQADVDAWNRSAAERFKTRSLTKWKSEYLRPSRAFVVLKLIEVPTDMYGANSRDFIVAPNVPWPIDRGSHNIYYSLDQGYCLGASPECDTLDI